MFKRKKEKVILVRSRSIPDLKGRNTRRTVSLIKHSNTLPTIV